MTTSCIENAFVPYFAKESENGWIEKMLAYQVSFLTKALNEILGVFSPGFDHICVGWVAHDFLLLPCSVGSLSTANISYGCPSLMLDLVEEFRPIIVDAVVLNMLNHRMLTAHDFVVEVGTYRLKDTREKLSRTP